MLALPVRLPDEIGDRLRNAAADEDESMNAIVVAAVAEYLDRRNLAHVLELARNTAEVHAVVLDRLAKA